MKIVLAPNAFKGSVTSAQAAAAMARGVRCAAPGATIDEIPIADGGDGLLEVAQALLGGEDVTRTVPGPLFTPVEATLLLERPNGRAVIEMARASGFALLGAPDRDPTRTTTLGTGALIRAALDEGASRIVVGIGGSATNDGGIGMARALGWRFLDVDGQDVTPTGGSLLQIMAIDGSACDPRLQHTPVDVVCDVDNPLCGSRGAARTYGPQKGATVEQVESLDRGLAHLADLVAAIRGSDERNAPGAGAAGGIGFGLQVFANGTLRPGAEVMLEWAHFEERLVGADLVITGEGRIDEQTTMGKAPSVVAKRARAAGVPCVAIAGSVTIPADDLRTMGIDAAIELCSGSRTLDDAQRHAERYLEEAAEEAVRTCRRTGH